MPAGELFELIAPLLAFISILVSAWVLASAHKRFSMSIAFAWAIGSLFLPFVLLPVYLATILLWPRPVRARRWPLLLPLAYAVVLLAASGFYLIRYRQTADAHLARAVQAKLTEDHPTAIREYRRALQIENDPHTHKLLALELAHADQLNEAAAEFRLAQQGGEPISCPEDDAKCKEAWDRIKRPGR